MALTIEELKVKLARELDEVTLLELLDISAEELVQAFHDKIEDNFNKLVREMDDEEWRD
jgi:hypothetical protein